LQKLFTNRGWLSSKIKACNFAKKLLKLVNSVKVDFIFGFNLKNIDVLENSETNVRLMDGSLKTMDIKKINVEIWLLFPPTYQTF